MHNRPVPRARGSGGVPDAGSGISFLGHTDQGGRGDGVQVMVHGGHAYVGHMFSGGVTVLDVRDPRDPHAVGLLPAAPREVAAFVPPPPERMYDTRPGRPRVVQSCDVFVDADAVLYVTDCNAGLYVLQYEGSP